MSPIAIVVFCSLSIHLLYGQPSTTSTTSTTSSTSTSTSTPFNATEFNNGTCCGCTESTAPPGSGCLNDTLCEQFVCATLDVNDHIFGGAARCCDGIDGSNGRWTPVCANAADSICNELGNITEITSGCCKCLRESDEPGCSFDSGCEEEICGLDSFCCDFKWDDLCVLQAKSQCIGEDSPKCCACTVQQDGPGCSQDIECQDALCEVDPYCCDTRWDRECTLAAQPVCEDGTDFVTNPPTAETNPPTDLPTSEPTDDDPFPDFTTTDNTIDPFPEPTSQPTDDSVESTSTTEDSAESTLSTTDDDSSDTSTTKTVINGVVSAPNSNRISGFVPDNNNNGGFTPVP